MQIFTTQLDKTNKHEYNNEEKFDVTLEPLQQTEYFDHDYNETYSLSGFTIYLTRSPIPFITKNLLQTGVLTLTSAISFLIPVDMVPGRMALLVTIFLMLVNISNAQKKLGPVVSNALSVHAITVCY